VGDELFGDQRRQQLPVQQGPSAVAVALGKVTQSCLRLEPIEDELRPPSETEPFEDRLGREVVFRKGHEEDDEFRAFESLRLQLVSVASRLPPGLVLRDPGGLPGLSQGAQAPTPPPAPARRRRPARDAATPGRLRGRTVSRSWAASRPPGGLPLRPPIWFEAIGDRHCSGGLRLTVRPHLSQYRHRKLFKLSLDFGGGG